MKSKTVRLFAVCYAFALLFWLLAEGFTLAKHIWYRSAAHNGYGAELSLQVEDFELSALKPFQNFEYPEEGWMVSTDSDPQMLWQGTAYVEQVNLYIAHEKPADGIELYYLLPGQEEYSLKQVAFARPIPGGYAFDLGGRLVQGLRIDTDSVGGVIARIEGVTLNPEGSLGRALMPTGKQVLLFACLPSLLAALIAQLGLWKQAAKKQ